MRLVSCVAVLCVAAVWAGCGAGHSTSNGSSSGTSGTGTSSSSSASGTVVTLSAETGNNTSAANSFTNQSNGNMGANNVSKVNIHSLLYSGATTKIFAQYLLWFGQSDHMNVGYTSNNATEVQNQIDDMVSRGIDGVIVDWYGPNNAIDQATQLVMQEAQKHQGFQFAIMVDAGAIAASSSGGSPQQTLIQLMQYVEKTYFPSSAYMTIGGQPVVTNFNIDLQYQIDWSAVNAALTKAPRYLFQNDDGFSHTLSDGSYSWVMPTAGDYGLGYLQNFYSTGMAFSNLETVGATYKGFNDTLASWSTDRVMGQQCGQTWLQTFQQINSQYSAQNQLPYLQLVTWNDYEEGTEMESGIDGCFSLNGSVTGNTLEWTISGDESTVDHYAVYASPDGNNLQQIAQVQPGTHSVDLCSAGVPSGTTQVFVQAVGKPSIANRMPGAITYTPGCS
jgi:hypothetical protein